MPLPSHSDGGLDVDAVARGLAEMEQAIAERDRFRHALETIEADRDRLADALRDIADGYERHNPGWWIKKAKAALARTTQPRRAASNGK